MSKATKYHKGQVFLKDFNKAKFISVRFKIEQVMFQKQNFSITRAEVVENDQNLLFPQNRISIKGNFVRPRVGDEYWGIAKLEDSPRYGYSLKLMKRPELIHPRSRAGIIKFFVKNIKGIGRKKAELIVDTFGENTLNILAKKPEKIQEVHGFTATDSMISEIGTELESAHTISDLMSLLSRWNLEEDLAFDVYEKHGSRSIDVVEYNPYILAEIDPLLWRKVDYIFYQQVFINVDIPNPKKYAAYAPRYRSAIKYYLKRALDLTGSLATPEEEIVEAFSSGQFLGDYGSFQDTDKNKPSNTEIIKQLSYMEEENSIVRVDDKLKNTYIYMRESYIAERRITQLVKKFNRTSKAVANLNTIQEFISEYESNVGFELANQQKRAVDLLVNNRFSILTGGPGTGKTQTLDAIKSFIYYLYDKGDIYTKDIAFLAPTGKASDRMSDVLGEKTYTIHRKLGLKGFGRSEDPKQIEEKYVVVDESSMIDVHLFATLLDSLSPDAHIILVGDADQLPSVGAGLVFRDLIDSGKVETVILDEVFRQRGASTLLENFSKMRRGIGYTGETDGLEFDTYKMKDESLKESYFIQTKTPLETKSEILNVVEDLVYHHKIDLSDIMILTPQKNGSVGTYQLNEALQLQFNPYVKENKSQFYHIRKSDNVIFSIHDPVIQLENNYQNNVFNGEVGRIDELDYDKADDELHIEVLYPGKQTETNYFNNEINQLNLAYSITGHKSQGSEWKVVIAVVDPSHQMMLKRSLVYTMNTRTRSINIMVGSLDALNQALNDTSDLKRTSLIKENL